MLRSSVSVFALAAVAFGCSWHYAIWIPRSRSADPLYRFVKNGKAGYIDGRGRILIPPKFPAYGNSGAEFHDGRLEIGASNGKYVDHTGEVVIDKGLYRGWDFSEGLAVAMRKGEDLWGYIDTSGEFVISPRFETYPRGYVWPFSDGLAMIESKGKFGYIDRSGEFVIKPEFLDGSSFREGMARVVTEGPCVYIPDGPCGGMNPVTVGKIDGGPVSSCKFTFIDRTGRVITQERFDQARDFSEGFAPVRIGNLWGFIDKTGSMVVSPRFQDAEPFSSGLARIMQAGRYGYADKTGRIVIAPQYQQAETFREGFAVINRVDHGWYIDQQGHRMPWGEFAAASPFFKGLAHVRLLSGNGAKERAQFAYLDRSGRIVFKY